MKVAARGSCASERLLMSLGRPREVVYDRTLSLAFWAPVRIVVVDPIMRTVGMLRFSARADACVHSQH